MPNLTLRILTLNTWLLRTPIGVDLADDVEDRLRLLPARVAALNPDIVILQEAWHPRLRHALAKAFEELGYPFNTDRMTNVSERLLKQNGETPPDFPSSLSHSAFGFSPSILALSTGCIEWFRSVMDNGLMIVSRFEMAQEIRGLEFSVHTRADERLVKKGAIKARVKVPRAGWIDVYDSHLGAVTYHRGRKRFDRTECERRLVQVQELSEWIASTRTSDFVVLGTDLNAHYHDFQEGQYGNDLSEEFATMICPPPYGLGLIDTFSVINGMQKSEAHTDDISNPYKKKGPFRDSPNAVLDYIFASNHKHLRPVASRVVLREPITNDERHTFRLRGTPPRISDHYGVVSSFHV